MHRRAVCVEYALNMFFQRSLIGPILGSGKRGLVTSGGFHIGVRRA